MLNKKKQFGGSTWGTMFIVLALIFGGVTAAKLWSPYFEDMAVGTAVKNIAEEDTTRAMSPSEIRATINKRLQVNNVTLHKDEIIIKKEDGEILIDVIYERRIPMYGNVDAVVKFNHSAKLNAKG
ncbi:MAG: DUF4845 domain-containing protein [Pseudomonadales bacterium]|nr:DUF4845 domain-containing protein [Pseudomonadales bacterium]